MTYYNEFDKNAAQWLRNLAQAGEISGGIVYERSIKEVRGADLAGIRRGHFFAGIGGWDLALRLAGWPDDEEVWTGSCPCQPFSAAGKGKGVQDERHLWPDFLRLIAEQRPATVFGEQVASKAGREWLVGVRHDLEVLGYAVGAADLCAPGVGAPHIRQRLYWVADRGLAQDSNVLGRRWGRDGDSSGHDGEVQAQGLRAVSGLADQQSSGLGREFLSAEREVPLSDTPGGGTAFGVDHLDAARCEPSGSGPEAEAWDEARIRGLKCGRTEGPWSDFRIIPCTDGKARRTGTRVFPLAYGISRGVDASGSWRKGLARGASRARIGVLKGSENAIVPELAAQFVMAYMETRAGRG